MKTSAFLSLFALATAAFAQSRDAEFNRLADRFFDQAVLRFDPEAGTAWGFHQYDQQLSSASRAEIQAQTDALHRFEAEVQNFDPRGLSPFVASDRELVLSQIRGTLLNLQTVRAWEKNPDIYSSGVTNAIFVVMSRNFAPAVRSAEIGDRAREADTARFSIGARESEEPAPDLHRRSRCSRYQVSCRSFRTTCLKRFRAYPTRL